MTFSQTYRTALIAIAGPLLTSVFHTQAVAQRNSPQGVRNIVIVHGAWADGSSWSTVIPLLQAKGLHVVAVQNPLTSLADDVAATKRAIALQNGPVPSSHVPMLSQPKAVADLIEQAAAKAGSQ
jgi:hypothetical protein